MPKIGRVEVFMDDEGRRIKRIVDIDDSKKAFIGETIITKTSVMEDGGQRTEKTKMHFPIKANSIKAAFGNFDRELKMLKKELKKRMEESQQKLATPSGQEVSDFGKSNRLRIVK